MCQPLKLNSGKKFQQVSLSFLFTFSYLFFCTFSFAQVKTMSAAERLKGLEQRKVLENKSAEASELKAAFEKLQTVSHKLTEEMYKAGAAAGAAGGAADAGAGEPAAGAEANNGSGKKDDVIDADFKDVN